MKKKNERRRSHFLTIIIAVFIVIGTYFNFDVEQYLIDSGIIDSYNISQVLSFDMSDVPEFSGHPYVLINNNIPNFPIEDYQRGAFEEYSELDSLGRCGVAYACIGKETMPTEERGEIGQVKPSGWQTKKYNCVDGRYLYNRCHLLAYQLTAENANKENLITGTRYLNVTGMLPFENEVADYVKSTGNHVLYRVTPIFEDNDSVAKGVQMEADSVENDEVCFNVYVYNVQPGVIIDYETGKSKLAKSALFSKFT